MKFEHFLNKILWILWIESHPAFPSAEIRRTKQNNFLSIFVFYAPFFLFKGIENCFALMFGLTLNDGNASHSNCVFGTESAGEQKFSSKGGSVSDITSPKPSSLSAGKKKYNHYEDSKEKQDYLNWCNDWMSEMVRITKPTGAIFVHNIPRWLSHYAEHLNKIAYFRHWIAWDSGGAPMGKTLLPNHYGILYYTKSKSHKDFKFYDIRYPHPRCRACDEFLKDYGGKKDQAHGFGPLLSDVWNDIHRIRHKKRRDEHPCQLPIPLLERLILMTTDENGIVLDPFVGTGTTAVAAKRLGRKYIGIELDSDYVKIAEKNVKAAKETKINGHFVSVYLGHIRTMRNKDFEEIWKDKGDLKLLDKKKYKITKAI